MADNFLSLIDAANPVAFFANGIGDALMTLPSLRALTSLFPDRLTLITHGHAGYDSLFKTLATKRQVCINSGTKCDWTPGEIDELTASIKCDLFISLVAWHSPSLGYLIKGLRPTKTIGYSAGYDIALPLDYTKHTAQLTFDAVRVISPNSKLDEFLDPPTYSSSSIQLAEAIKASLDTGVQILAVHMETLPEKLWAPVKLAEVLDSFLYAHTEYIALLVNYRDYPLTLSSPVNQNRLIAQPGLLLEDALCLVHYADCFLGADSCMLHAADLGRVPSVGLFGPTSAHEFGFLIGPHVAIQASSDINQIEVECVISALESLLRDRTYRAVWRV